MSILAEGRYCTPMKQYLSRADKFDILEADDYVENQTLFVALVHGSLVALHSISRIHTPEEKRAALDKAHEKLCKIYKLASGTCGGSA